MAHYACHNSFSQSVLFRGSHLALANKFKWVLSEKRHNHFSYQGLYGAMFLYSWKTMFSHKVSYSDGYIYLLYLNECYLEWIIFSQSVRFRWTHFAFLFKRMPFGMIHIHQVSYLDGHIWLLSSIGCYLE